MRSICINLAILTTLGALSGSAGAEVASTPVQGLTGFLVSGSTSAEEPSTPSQGLARFLERLGGSIDIRLLDRGNWQRVKALVEWGSSPYVIGTRYFRSRNMDALADAERARIFFNEECIARGGSVEPEAGLVAQNTLDWARHDFPEAKEYPGAPLYRALVSVCTKGDQPMGAVMALIEDNTTLAHPTTSPHNRTVVYTFAADWVASKADIEQFVRERAIDTARNREMAEFTRRSIEQARRDEKIRLMAWRKTITIGTRTNCGLIIDQRGPLVQVQLSVGTMLTGTREYWIERDRLSDSASSQECQF